MKLLILILLSVLLFGCVSEKETIHETIKEVKVPYYANDSNFDMQLNLICFVNETGANNTQIQTSIIIINAGGPYYEQNPNIELPKERCLIVDSEIINIREKIPR